MIEFVYQALVKFGYTWRPWSRTLKPFSASERF